MTREPNVAVTAASSDDPASVHGSSKSIQHGGHRGHRDLPFPVHICLRTSSVVSVFQALGRSWELASYNNPLYFRTLRLSALLRFCAVGLLRRWASALLGFCGFGLSRCWASAPSGFCAFRRIFFGTIIFHPSRNNSKTSSQSGERSRYTPTHPLGPTYAGLKYLSGCVRIINAWFSLSDFIQ